MYKCVFLILFSFFMEICAELKVSSDFTGASAKNIQISANHLTLSPGGEGDRGFTCWWYVKVENVNLSEPFSVTVNAAGLKQSRNRGIGSFWALPDKMSYSYDNKNWVHSENGTKSKNKATWTVKNPQQSTIWVAWGAPYLPADSKRLVDKLPTGIAKPFVLCKTRAGNEVHAVKISSSNNISGKKAVWIQARQHAWESGSSWVGEGLIEWICSDNSDAVKLREKAVIYYVPIMDVDNVATGNGGKEQSPHDHNRDWSDKPHWNSVTEAQKIIFKHIEDNTMSLFLDLHNPGPSDKNTFLFVTPLDIQSQSNQESQKKFIADLKKFVTGPLPFKNKVVVSGKNYHPMWKTISKSWFVLNSTENSCGVTIEIPWNTPKSLPEGYKKCGAEIGRAVSSFIE
ncbi:MAG: M14-type cytosolic carboxypeptidase [Lentisphaeraceae bacterium]|nr:M14-type cytosolic carboxypeptidase [Lentisphaeraceae bacterium]